MDGADNCKDDPRDEELGALVPCLTLVQAVNPLASRKAKN